MFKSIRWRITFIFFSLFLITILLLSGVLSRFLENYFMANLTDQLATEATIVQKFISVQYPFQPKELDALVKDIGQTINIRITVIDSTGKVLSDSEEDVARMDNHRLRPEFAQALQGEVGDAVRYSTTIKENLKYIAMPIKHEGAIVGAVRVSIPTTEISQALSEINSILTYTFMIAILVFIILSLRLSSIITTPLEELTRSATRIALGDLRHRIFTSDQGEIGQLQHAINFMAEKQQEKLSEIEDKKSKLEAVLANMTSGIIVVNKKCYVNMINQAAENMLNVQTDQVLGKTCLAIMRNKELQGDLEKVLLSGKVLVREIHLEKPVERFIQVVSAPIYHGKSLKEAVMVLTDISTIKQLEKMRSQFVANVSHELKTPLTSIKGFVETLQSGVVSDQETADRFLSIIATETERLSRLIEDILELSKIESNKKLVKLEPVNLNSLIEATVQQLANEAAKKKLAVYADISEQYQVIANNDGLKQVFLNLLQNAINYTPPGGQIDIQVLDGANQVQVSIADTGIGIPQEDLPRIFERFYRVDKARSRQEGGTGLGLSIVKHLVESFGGSIWAKSQEGKGSTFYFTLTKTTCSLEQEH